MIYNGTQPPSHRKKQELDRVSALQCCRNLQEIMMVSERCLPLVRSLNYNASPILFTPYLFSFFPPFLRSFNLLVLS